MARSLHNQPVRVPFILERHHRDGMHMETLSHSVERCLTGGKIFGIAVSEVANMSSTYFSHDDMFG